MTAPIVRVALDEAAFRKLVSGKVAECSGIASLPIAGRRVTVQIILSDIGFDRMEAALDDAQSRGLAKPEHDQT